MGGIHFSLGQIPTWLAIFPKDGEMEETEKNPTNLKIQKRCSICTVGKTAKSQLKKTGSYRFQNFSFPVSRQTLERTDQISDALQ
mmetsp:Transcript_40912/g.47044  ORF Transcript_40912/g.47044 Transcript_40912/m.47044 type:complete len:85 (-) Transcript_40912:479-733(-)